MSDKSAIPAALAIDAFPGDARAAFDVAANAHYHGIAFATNHAELTPDDLTQSARRHLKKILSTKNLSIDAIRVAVPRTSLADPSTIDRAIENARKAILLAHDLGVSTVSLNVGNLAIAKTPNDTLIAAIRELAQHADAASLTLALGSDTTTLLGGILKGVGYDRARINFDTSRLIGAGEDVLKTAEALAGTVGQLTAADAIRAGSTLRATYLGEGQTAWPELLEILQDQDFRGPTIVDVRDLPSAADGARHAAAVLRKLLG